MIELQRWLGGIILGFGAIIGLFISAHADDGGFAFFGGLLSLFSILLLFRLIALATASPETHS
jgi:hypothetical protein